MPIPLYLLDEVARGFLHIFHKFWVQLNHE